MNHEHAPIHSVKLLEDRCTGCTVCLHNCPTEAIRIVDGKARINPEACIDCGRCIEVCPMNAKTAESDPLEAIQRHTFRIALPSLPFYSQFPDQFSRNEINQALLDLGFHVVEDLSYHAEVLSVFIKDVIRNKSEHRPVISSYCPAVIRLIQLHHPELIENISSLESPMEIAARDLKTKFTREQNLPRDEVGVFFLAQCPAKITSIRSPLGIPASSLDGALSIRDLVPRILKILPGVQVTKTRKVPCRYGELWSVAGGQKELGNIKKTLTVDGIAEVDRILDMVELGKLEDIDYIEAYSCRNGCVGGPLNVENHYLSRYRTQRHCCSCLCAKEYNVRKAYTLDELCWHEEIVPIGGMELDADYQVAIEKLQRAGELLNQLPGIDCGACGAPSCRALAEDIVKDRAKLTDCIFIRAKGE